MPNPYAVGFWSFAAGVAVLAAVEFSGGLVVGADTAAKTQAAAVHHAKVAVMADMCAYRFAHQPNAAEALAAFRKTPSYDQREFITKSAYFTPQGLAVPDGYKDDTASACADRLNDISNKEASAK